MLTEFLAKHRGPLSASFLAVYHVRFTDALHAWGALEVADLVAHLPAGCALWQSVGGPRAWSDLLHLLMRIELRLRELLWQGGQKKNAPKPEPVEPPPLAGAEEIEQARISEAQRRFNARFK